MNHAGAASGDFLRFQQLWQRCLDDNAEDHSADIHSKLLSAYSEPQRVYHDLSHIDHCLSMFDLARQFMQNPDLVELAVWMHDVVYQPGASDNEARSVDWYRAIAANTQRQDSCEQVCQMIMATQHDNIPPPESDAAYMVDIDLSSFALPWDEFLQDGANLRLENPQRSDSDYYSSQIAFQKSLLARERFYYTDFFHQQFETRARDNLARYFEQVNTQREIT